MHLSVTPVNTLWENFYKTVQNPDTSPGFAVYYQ